ncbi:MAG: inositol-3-phosphate synthase [Planctomycetota bacterium]
MKTGVWIIGAYGSVSACAVCGAEGIKKGLVGRTGLVTELPGLKELDLASMGEIVFGGCDVRRTDMVAAAEEVRRDPGIVTRELIDALRQELLEISRDVTPGCALNCGEEVTSMAKDGGIENGRTASEVVAEIQRQIKAFRDRHKVDRVIVVNLASTEAGHDAPKEYGSLKDFARLIVEDRRKLLCASVLYAYAAIDLGCPYVNFTPSFGASIPAMEELATIRGVPHAGKDGKTGETLVKTALAPMFLARNLRLLSWESHNILGNRDGLVLRQPGANRSKTKDKEEALRQLVKDESLHSHVSIDYCPSLGDWKTAWNFIHFEGFLGTKMTMQFTWQGCDSALAAPLVLDLVRMTDFAARRGESGALRHLACFFKSPAQVREHDFFKQFAMLMDYVERAHNDAPARRPVAGGR